MSEISSASKWDRSKLIQSLVSGATGLLVTVDLLSVRIPLYFFWPSDRSRRRGVSFCRQGLSGTAYPMSLTRSRPAPVRFLTLYLWCAPPFWSVPALCS
jgi:hypothetical protein